MRMIVKSGKNPTRPDSYRPISLLEVPGSSLRGSSQGDYAATRMGGICTALDSTDSVGDEASPTPSLSPRRPWQCTRHLAAGAMWF